MIVGEGPELAKLKAKYPKAHFLGHRPNDELAEIYASADVFVFPSRTDTFGNVIIEALASGTPVAAYPVTGPIDIVGDGFGGAVSNDLSEARSPRSTSTAPRRANAPCATAGKPVPKCFSTRSRKRSAGRAKLAA